MKIRDPAVSKLIDSNPDISTETKPKKAFLSGFKGKGIKKGTFESRILRVGYDRDRIPFSYLNSDGELVGYDIEMAHRLAKDINCSLEFVPFNVSTIVEDLNNRNYDIIMSAIPITADKLEAINFTQPYLELTFSLVVKDDRVKAFSTRESLETMDPLTIAIVDPMAWAFRTALQAYLPHAEIITLKTNREFFEAKTDLADALLISAEAGSAWTLLYPEYEVAIPKPKVSRFALGYPMAKDEAEFEKFMNNWLNLQMTTDEYQILYDHWILGRDVEVKQPRWSVIKDVFHWVE